MAVSKPTRRTAATKPTNPVAPNESDPMSWLYVNPAGPSPSGLVFGVLRKTYGGRVNSALEFGWRKNHLGGDGKDADFCTWSPNVERMEVILPEAADDMLGDPATLLRQMDVPAAECEKAFLGPVSLSVQSCREACPSCSA